MKKQRIKPIISDALVTESYDDVFTPGVIVALHHDEAENWGAFEETALTAQMAWESNLDLEGDAHE